MKTKTKCHGDEVTGLYDKNFSQVGCNHICLAVISLDYALKKDYIYYPQVFLKECKFIEKKIIRQINENLIDFSYPYHESDED